MSESGLAPIAALPVPIDPLAPGKPGRYDDHLVTVLRTGPGGDPGRWPAQPPPAGPPSGPGPAVICTEHFRVTERNRRIEVAHWLAPDEIDNDVAGLLADELFAPGWLSGTEIFERVFTGIVRSALPEPLQAWNSFYGNTLARIRRCWRDPAPADGSDLATIAGFAPVYAHALRLMPPGPVLDLGSCFGFLPLLLAERPGNTVTACDLSEGSMRLLQAVAAARGVQLATLVCDAARIPVPDRCADTVSIIHLLEHLPSRHGAAVLREALRVARRKVVAAVPLEAVPDPVYGHVRAFDLPALRALGAASGARWTVHEHHGGWLILTR
ncbi:MAG: mycofactocin oligosaccharide methyltransferase MftM [Streptosporangiaceae bacterium]